MTLLFLLGKSRCWGQVVVLELSTSCTTEPQAEPGKGCEVSNTSLNMLPEKAPPAAKSLLPHAVALLSATPAPVGRGRGDEVMWGVGCTTA